MIFAKIAYLNLLPFDIFLKKYYPKTYKIANYKSSYPSKINKLFLTRKIDCAFISSIVSNNSCKNIGIVAKKEVLSVIGIKDTKYKKDIESQTSNILAKILKVDNQILIGDKALKYVLENDNYIDLALLWYQKYKLPFVFALLCCNRYNIDTKDFKNIKIPQYILKKYSKKISILPKDILFYLDKISYNINSKEKLSLKKFKKLAKGLR